MKNVDYDKTINIGNPKECDTRLCLHFFGKNLVSPRIATTEQKRYIEKASHQFCCRSADGPFQPILGKTQKIFIKH